MLDSNNPASNPLSHSMAKSTPPAYPNQPQAAYPLQSPPAMDMGAQPQMQAPIAADAGGQYQQQRKCGVRGHYLGC